MTDVISLPESGDGSRRARREQSPRGKRARGRRWPVVLLVVVVVAAAGGWLVFGDNSGDDDDAQSPTTASGAPTTRLLLERLGDGGIAGATLIIDRRSGGELVYLPPGTLVEAPSLGLVPLREAADVSTHDLLVATLENLLGVRIDAVTDLTPDQFTDAVRPAAPLRINLPTAVERQVGDRIETAFDQGLVELEAAQVLDFLDLPARTDLDRLVRHQLFWNAWLAAIRGGGSEALPASLPDGVRAELAHLASGDAGHHVLPVTAIGGGEELYKVNRSQLDALLRRILPSAPAQNGRITVQVLNGTGQPGVAQQLVRPLLAAGARMSLSGNADRFGYETTQIIYYDDSHADDARKVQAALGMGEVVKSRSALRVVAVTVVVGSDFTSSRAGTTSTSQGARP
jgi:hypothetical protein